MSTHPQCGAVMQGQEPPLATQSDRNGACKQHAPYSAAVIVIMVIMLP